MLVLSRKENEKILLKINETEQIELTVIQINRNKVKVGIDANNNISILRSELIQPSPQQLAN